MKKLYIRFWRLEIFLTLWDWGLPLAFDYDDEVDMIGIRILCITIDIDINKYY